MVKFVKLFCWYTFVTLPESVFLFLFYSFSIFFRVIKMIFCLPFTFPLFFAGYVSAFSVFVKYCVTSYALVWPAPVRVFFSRIALVLTFPLDLLASTLIWCSRFVKASFGALFFVLKLTIFSIFIAPLLYTMYLFQRLWMWVALFFYSLLLVFLRIAGLFRRIVLLINTIYKSLALLQSSFMGFKKSNWRVFLLFILHDLRRQQFGSLVAHKVNNFRSESRVLDLDPYHLVKVARSAYYPFSLRMGRYHQFLSKSGPLSSAVRASTDVDVLRWYKVMSPFVGDRTRVRLGSGVLLPCDLSHPYFFSNVGRCLDLISFLRYSLLFSTLKLAPFSSFSNRYINLLFYTYGHSVEWFEDRYNFVLLDSLFSYNLYDFLSPATRSSSYQFNRRPGTTIFYGSIFGGYGDSNFYDVSKPKQLSGAESIFFVDDLDHYNHGFRVRPSERFWFKRLLERSLISRDLPSGPASTALFYSSAFSAYFELFSRNTLWAPVVPFNFSRVFRYLLYYCVHPFFYLNFTARVDFRSQRWVWSVFWYELCNELFRVFVYIPIYIVGLFQRFRCLLYKLRVFVYAVPAYLSTRFWVAYKRVSGVPLCDLVHNKFVSLLKFLIKRMRNKVLEARRCVFGSI